MCVLIAITDLVLLGVMVHYTSWPFMLSFVFLSAIVGAWLLNDGLRSYLKKAQNTAAAGAMSADVFLLARPPAWRPVCSSYFPAC